MRHLRRIGATVLVLALLLTMNLIAFAAAADAAFSDVDAGSWYADAVTYVLSSGLMNGTTATTFEPSGTMTRGMLVTTLYRMAGSPSLADENLGYPFADVPGDAWYADGVYWARLTGVVNGYSDEQFGPNDPVSREQIATVFWRTAGSPKAAGGEAFSDGDAISAWAVDAVAWTRGNGLINGREGNRFVPQDGATRAEVATILRNYLTMDGQQTPDAPEAGKSRVLVAYFSATGNTEAVAGYIADATGGDLFEIMPADPYTDEDLNWTDESSRVVYEYENPEARDTELAAYTPENWSDYDVVFIGYPIWWYDAAWPVDGFVEANDFTGKTVIPFCTSSSSGLGDSGARLAESAGNDTWLEGRRFRSGASQAEVQTWVESLNVAFE